VKDKIFIIWSGSDILAHKVKNILEKEHNYLCFVGGNFEGSTQMLTVGDTVLKQMRVCNQAIAIFGNKNNGAISSNLFFELGFATSTYGLKKIHCVKKSGEQILLPSDFDNSFVHEVQGGNDEEIARNIVSYFISRQKLSIDTNKMYLINNRHKIHDKIQVHYSELGSSCSDYELAQYILFYMQASVMYQDEAKVLDELVSFKRDHNAEFSAEVTKAVNISISLLEIQKNLIVENDLVYIDDNSFRKFYSNMKDMLSDIGTDNSGTFDEWAKVIESENLSYVCSLYSVNPKLDPKMAQSLRDKNVKYGRMCLDYIEELMSVAPCSENNDDIGLIAMFKAYLYRHLYNGLRNTDKNEAIHYLNESIKEIKLLLRNFDNHSVDTRIYENFEMEYYVNILEYIEVLGKDEIEEFDYMMYMSEIDEFISKFEKRDSTHAFMKKIFEHRSKF